MIFAASTHHKFANTALGISDAIGSLRGKALVIVVVAVDDDFGVGVDFKKDGGENGARFPPRWLLLGLLLVTRRAAHAQGKAFYFPND